MQKIHTPVQTARKFVTNYLKLNVKTLFYDPTDATLTIHAKDTKNNKYKIVFDGFDVTCDKIGDLKKKWLNFVFYHDPKYFNEYCDALLQESKETVEDDRQHIDNLIEQGIYKPD